MVQSLVYGNTFQGVVGIRFLVVAAMARKFKLLQCDSGDPVIAPQTKNEPHVENLQHAFDWLGLVGWAVGCGRPGGERRPTDIATAQ